MLQPCRVPDGSGEGAAGAGVGPEWEQSPGLGLKKINIYIYNQERLKIAGQISQPGLIIAWNVCYCRECLIQITAPASAFPEGWTALLQTWKGGPGGCQTFIFPSFLVPKKGGSWLPVSHCIPGLGAGAGRAFLCCFRGILGTCCDLG